MSRHIVTMNDGITEASLVDTAGACLLDHVGTAVVHLKDGRQLVALDMEGRIDRRRERLAQLFLMDGRTAASLVAEVMAVFARVGQAEEFMGWVGEAVDAQIVAAEPDTGAPPG